MKRSWLLWLTEGVLAVTLAAAAGWLLARPASTDEIPADSGLQILMFLDTWGRAGGRECAFTDIKITENPEDYDPDGDITFRCEKPVPSPVDKILAVGSAHKRNGKVCELSVYWQPAGPATEEKLRFLQPFYDALIATLDPSVSPEERAAVLQTLKLRPQDFGSLRTLPTKDRPCLTMNGIEYQVSYWGSDEGGTVVFRGRILETAANP